MTTTPTPPDIQTVTQCLHTEAMLLDQRRWHDWLALFTPDCRFWLPSWRTEDELITDPRREVSFLYLTERRTLEERVRRVEQGKSITSHPLPRTCHVLGTPVPEPLTHAGPSAAYQVGAGPWWLTSWVNHLYDPRTCEHTQLFGQYRHRLVFQQGQWKIAEKIITLANDRVPTVLDFYSV